ncbi:glutathione-dependent formaldehyde dehydrogenase [Corallococcus exiguus]|uniref:zinc-dependent alcohol dehydrogenase n=1 Tax=Corallococcus TaxID=83461 RepID=UPI000EECE84E|nr:MULTISPECIES: zinc-dependent alcohol dehydrogenase [Corallococcus]NNC20792.1 glutathione-dependent formaldehyde dehydrogenase [Corallococcus exiguus]NRD57729.1 glutathione-dependent formaldehyde dehydrogenase [Corallococcus exiguus]NRD67539.1 glutathione-dependent formaldehyde dehydrogenase [Corallococcus exiguus]RKH99817.1 glutathione-dependent formaldehyde dehydrogenase [Corallococcus sp. AB030]RUO87863.1 glutathione-dependent formaldehyde dehydrogenase [Corallococcus sp. AB018]
MKAICWHGHGDVRYESAPDPKIEDPRDAIIRVTRTAICGSDLHLLDGYMPTMKSGDVLGHEFMGEVMEIGSGVTKLKKGDRVIVPFNIACGECFFCQKTLFSLCDRSNRNAEMAAKVMGYSPSGLFGYSHMLGGFSGGQAEYVRVPYADVGPLKIPDGLTEDQVLFLTDIFPTGYMAAENCEMEKGDTVAVWGCGPVGQFAIQSAWMFGAGRVIAIDHVPERLALAKSWGKAETIDFTKQDVYETLKEMTRGRGPDRCIDSVGAEAHGTGSLDAVIDKAKAAVKLATDRPHALRQAIHCCRKGGSLSVPGVYVGFLDKVPMGAFVNKGLTMKSGQTHTHRYTRPLLEKIQSGAIDPTRLITHRARLADAPALYKKFRDKEDGCIKVVMTP